MKTAPQPPNVVPSGRARRLKALITKELLQIVRDPSSILISVVLPLILMFIYGFGVSLDLDHLRLGLVLEDTSPDAQSFAKSLTNSRYFNVKTAQDRRELERDLTRGSIRGMVIVPSYFTAFRDRPDNIAPIQVIADGSEPNTANFVVNYVQGAWQVWLQLEKIAHAGKKSAAPVAVQSRFWYNQQLESRNFLIPGSLAIIMTLIGTLLTALVVSREWERGTMEALMSTPVRIFELLLGKLLPYYFLGLGSMFICVAISTYGYGIPFRGSPLTLVIVVSAFLFGALGLGLLVSTLSKSQQVASQVSLVLGFLPAFMLSGFLFEISSMPYPIQLMTYLFPARYFVTSLQTLFLVGDVWALIIPNTIAMVVFGLVLFLITARFTAKRLD